MTIISYKVRVEVVDEDNTTSVIYEQQVPTLDMAALVTVVNKANVVKRVRKSRNNKDLETTE